MRHMWRDTQSQQGFATVQQCAHCDTQRVRDVTSKTLYLYRGGRAKPPRGTLDPKWRAFKAGVVPKCPGPEIAP